MLAMAFAVAEINGSFGSTELVWRLVAFRVAEFNGFLGSTELNNCLVSLLF